MDTIRDSLLFLGVYLYILIFFVHGSAVDSTDIILKLHHKDEL